MKKIISVLLLCALSLTLLAACGNTQNQQPQQPEEPKGVDLSGETLSAIIDKIYAEKAIELGVGTLDVDLTGDMAAYYTGLSDVSNVKEAAVSEAMIGSQAYSMVLVRVNDAAKAQETAQAMMDGIDTRKWICVEADDLDVGIYGDLVLLVMIDSQFGAAADYIGAFKTVCGGTLDAELSK